MQGSAFTRERVKYNFSSKNLGQLLGTRARNLIPGLITSFINGKMFIEQFFNFHVPFGRFYRVVNNFWFYHCHILVL